VEGVTTLEPMRIEGHYDAQADIAWLRFDGYDPKRVVGEETGFGLLEVDPDSRRLWGLEFWRASTRLPNELLSMLENPAAVAEPDRER
jgi:uncharacterized protein YuzE